MQVYGCINANLYGTRHSKRISQHLTSSTVLSLFHSRIPFLHHLHQFRKTKRNLSTCHEQKLNVATTKITSLHARSAAGEVDSGRVEPKRNINERKEEFIFERVETEK